MESLSHPDVAHPRVHPLRSFIYGLVMGAADAVPGISGATIALVLGFYVRLLDGLSRLLGAPRRLRTPEGRAELLGALAFLLPLGLGVLASYWLATKFLVGATDQPGWLRRAATAPFLYAGFSGLVVASAWRVWQRIPSPRYREVGFALLGAAAAFAFVGLPHVQSEPPEWALLPGGALAISVMLLPGVSGSLLLLILGQYTVVSMAVHDRDAVPLAFFAVGLVLGVLLIVPILRWLLAWRPRPTLAALTGLMVGSLRSLWPWKLQYDPEVGPLTNHLDVLSGGWGALLGLVACLVLGGAAVWAMEVLEARLAPPEVAPEPAGDAAS